MYFKLPRFLIEVVTMGRGRAPCCAKVGLNKGSWTPEEDKKLITYIHKHGHGNWRALPKHAGLLRCGKSCRLRWINYLRPDVKRGNFTKEEEETIINLHALLGSKWSKIASSLPGRTDNEIKNVWNTHLKKRLAMPGEQPSSPSSVTTASMSCSDEGESKGQKEQIDRDSEINNNIDKIQIPIGSNSSNLSDMSGDSSISQGYDMGIKDDSLVVDLPEISIEPEIWNMMNEEDLEIETTEENNTLITMNESDYWLEYLEKELDSTTSNFAETVGGGDPISSYFHSWPSSSSSFDLLY